jgi:hypothetical protein
MHDYAPSQVPKLPKTGASQCTSKTALATHVDGQHRLSMIDGTFLSMHAEYAVSAYSSMCDRGSRPWPSPSLDYMPPSHETNEDSR